MKNALISPHLIADYSSIPLMKQYGKNTMIGLDPTFSHNQAFQKILTHHFNHFLKYESLLLASDGYDVSSDVIHDMRVTLRRIESTLRIFQQDFKVSQMTLLKNSLKDMIHRLSMARDLDVFIDNMVNYQHKLANEMPLSEDEKKAMLTITADFNRQRKKAVKKIITLLKSKEHIKFKHKIHLFLAKNTQKTTLITMNKRSPYKISHIAFSAVYKSYERVRVRHASLDNATIEQLHNFRKECKNLRYLIENFEDILGKESANVLTEIKKVQDYLGELNDTQVAQDFLRYYFSRDITLSEKTVPVTISTYLSHIKEKQNWLLDGFPVFWHQINTLKLRRQLALAIAAL